MTSVPNLPVHVRPEAVQVADHHPSCAVCDFPMHDFQCARCGCGVRLKQRSRKPAVYTAR